MILFMLQHKNARAQEERKKRQITGSHEQEMKQFQQQLKRDYQNQKEQMRKVSIMLYHHIH